MKHTKIILSLLIGLIVIVVASQFGKEFINNIIDTNQNNFTKIDENKPWFRNAFYGISVETPYKLEQQDTKIPEGYEEYIDIIKNYYSDNGDVIINSLFIDSNFKEYDVIIGLEGSINNWIYTVKGTNVKLNFSEVENGFDDIICSGSFHFNNNDGIIRGYCYWNGKGKIATIVGLGRNTENTKIILDRMIDSIRLAF